MIDPLVQHYVRLIRTHGLDEEFCYTVVTSATGRVTLEAVAESLGAGGDTSRRLRLHAWADHDDSHVLLPQQIDRAVAILEPFGYQGNSKDVLSRLSEHGEAWNTFWDVNMRSELICAAKGEPVAGRDFLEPDEKWGKDRDPFEPHRPLLAEYAELLGSRYPNGAAMAVIERCSGVHLPIDALTGELPAVLLPLDR
ncbi:hypothetical protein [Bailinhaonella thermotolerans]|uniref:hypothetical protein n=1 Tax=Bailinhaonella thermotolerans TaxID=1070861 RepID=UPI0011C3FF51|nr:hypothetical protein [Bailinhaonella thermotolerans]